MDVSKQFMTLLLNSYAICQYLESHSVYYHKKKDTEFKNYLIPAIMTSHLQKRLSNCHCPHRKGSSDNSCLHMKFCMYLKILEVCTMGTLFMARTQNTN